MCVCVCIICVVVVSCRWNAAIDPDDAQTARQSEVPPMRSVMKMTFLFQRNIVSHRDFFYKVLTSRIFKKDRTKISIEYLPILHTREPAKSNNSAPFISLLDLLTYLHLSPFSSGSIFFINDLLRSRLHFLTSSDTCMDGTPTEAATEAATAPLVCDSAARRQRQRQRQRQYYYYEY